MFSLNTWQRLLQGKYHQLQNKKKTSFTATAWWLQGLEKSFFHVMVFYILFLEIHGIWFWCCRKKQSNGQADSNYQSYTDVSSISSCTSMRRPSPMGDAKPITNPELRRQLRLTNSSSTRLRPQVSHSFPSLLTRLQLNIFLKVTAPVVFLCSFYGYVWWPMR